MCPIHTKEMMAMQDHRDDERVSRRNKKQVKRAIKRAYNKKHRTRSPGMLFWGIAVAAVVCFSFTNIVRNKLELAKKQEELAELQQKVADLETENASYENILNEEKPNQVEKISLKYNDAKRFIPSSVPIQKAGEYIMKALEFYQRYQERQRGMDAR
jgi:cell division protein FtsL